MNLILAELVIALYGVPVDFVAAVNRGWVVGEELCFATGFILTLMGKR